MLTLISTYIPSDYISSQAVPKQVGKSLVRLNLVNLLGTRLVCRRWPHFLSTDFSCIET